MPDLLIRDLSPPLKKLIESEAKKRGLSLSDQAKWMLSQSLSDDKNQQPLGQTMRTIFSEAGHVDLDVPKRTDLPEDPFTS
ncbi:MAG: hypothetical protein AAFO68_00880 [Pseudomonadota bacterium]